MLQTEARPSRGRDAPTPFVHPTEKDAARPLAPAVLRDQAAPGKAKTRTKSRNFLQKHEESEGSVSKYP
jgi:hypothetical protein